MKCLYHSAIGVMSLDISGSPAVDVPTGSILAYNTTAVTTLTESIPTDTTHTDSIPTDTNVAVLTDSVPADNIQASDREKMLDELKILNSELQYPTEDTPPATFARESTVADSYISLVNAWNETENSNVININPQGYQPISHAAERITVRQDNSYGANSRHVPYPARSDIMYESDDDEINHGSASDLEEKIDATYNKLCSLVMINADAVDAAHKANGQLENINRHGVLASKSNRIIEEKIDRMGKEMTSIKQEVIDVKQELTGIKQEMTSIKQDMKNLLSQLSAIESHLISAKIGK
jgi:hypothetical protein